MLKVNCTTKIVKSLDEISPFLLLVSETTNEHISQGDILMIVSVSRDLKLINFTKQMYIELTEKESGYIFASYYEENKIPTKLAEILEDDDIIYLDIDENYELQNIVLPIKKSSEVKASIYKTEYFEINWLNTKIEDLSSTVDKKEKAIIRVLSIIENKFKTLHLWNTINTLWIIVLTIVILNLI